MTAKINGLRVLCTGQKPLSSGLRVNTGIVKVDEHFSHFDLNGSLVEWGCPHGKMGRVLPSLFLKNMEPFCLWISDQTELGFYTKFYESLGIDVKKIFFIKVKDPLKTVRTAILENAFKVLVVDTKEYISQSDQNFFALKARENSATYFILRPFYLTNKNGNPFSRYRVNSSFNIKSDRFNIHCIKGDCKKKSLSLARREVFCG